MNAEQFTSKPPRLPVAYQTRGQLPLTLLALVVIATSLFASWILSI